MVRLRRIHVCDFGLEMIDWLDPLVYYYYFFILIWFRSNVKIPNIWNCF